MTALDLPRYDPGPDLARAPEPVEEPVGVARAQHRDEHDPLSGRIVRVGIGAVAVAAAVLSFSNLRDLAVLTSTSPWLAWLLPIAIDAAAAVSTVIWLRSPRPEVVALARRLAWAAIGLSVLGNGVQHAYAAAHAIPPWEVAVAVGAVAPAILGAVIHLVVTARTPPNEDRVAVTAPITPVPETGEPDPPAVSPIGPPQEGTALERGEAWVRAVLTAGAEMPTLKVINDGLGKHGYIKGHHLTAWRAQWEREQA